MRIVFEKLRQILEEYRKVREGWSEIEKPSENTPQSKKWLEKKPFYKLTDLFLAFVTLVLTPNLLGPVLRNITNKWIWAIFSLVVPCVRCIFGCRLLLGGSVFSLKALSFLMSNFKPYSMALLKVVQIGSPSNTPVYFMEVLLKCISPGFLSGIICCNFLRLNGQNKQQRLLAVGVPGGRGIGIFLISNSTAWNPLDRELARDEA